ncbi:MAG: tetratricopeptide repeat protein [Saprospiraceae bacterium]|nr:tetratricopeptide repeat protein [Saprospiraceae bacterium]
MRIAKHAIRLSPRNSYAYNVEALVYLKSKDYLRAEASFLQAIKLDPCYIDAFYNVACIKSLKQDYKAAKIYLESAINCGFSDIDFAREDPDLELFRNQVEWNELLGSVLLKDKK